MFALKPFNKTIPVHKTTFVVGIRESTDSINRNCKSDVGVYAHCYFCFNSSQKIIGSYKI